MKLKISNPLFLFSFVLSLVFVREILFLFYDSTQSPDFDKYRDYIAYFYGLKDSTGRDQGIFYYYLHSQYLYLFNSGINENNLSFYLSRTIQDLNFFLHIIGSLGTYKLLKFLNYKKFSILASLIVLNFFPLSISNRITYKPEILAFALLPWIIYCFEAYKSEKSVKYFFFSIPLIVALFTSKGSVLGMVGLFLFLTYFKLVFSLQKKHLILLFLSFVILLSAVTYEDIQANDVSLLNVTHDEKYNNKAELKNIYSLNFVKLMKSPIRDDHSGSMIALTLLDIFGDYFDLYWDNDATSLFKNRKEVFLFDQTNKIKPPKIDFQNQTVTIFFQKITDVYFREFIGLIFSLIFLLILLNHILFRKTNSRLVMMPIYGVIILLIMTVGGFPVPNWDPLIGDTVKPFYYSFFVFLSLTIVLSNYFSKKYVAILFLLVYIPFSMYLIGFPKKNVNDELLFRSNQYSYLCEINTYTFTGLNNFDKDLCVTKSLEFKDQEFSFDYNNRPKFKILNTFLALLSSLSIYTLQKSKLSSKINKS